MQSVTVQEENKAKKASGPVPTRRRLSQLLGHQASHRTGDAGEADKPADSPAHAPVGDAGGADCNRSVHKVAEARTCEADSSHDGGEHRAAAAAAWMRHAGVHRRCHASVHVHLVLRHLHVVFHLLTLDFFFVLFFLPFLDRVHAVVLVGLTFVERFLFGRELLPGSSDETSDGTTFGWYATFCLLKTEHMGREEHIVARLIALAIRLLVGRLVLRHLLFVALAIGFGPAFRLKNERKRMRFSFVGT